MKFQSVLTVKEQKQWLIENNVYAYNWTFEFNQRLYVVEKAGIYFYVIDMFGKRYEKSIRKTTAIYYACLLNK